MQIDGGVAIKWKGLQTGKVDGKAPLHGEGELQIRGCVQSWERWGGSLSAGSICTRVCQCLGKQTGGVEGHSWGCLELQGTCSPLQCELGYRILGGRGGSAARSAAALACGPACSAGYLWAQRAGMSCGVSVKIIVCSSYKNIAWGIKKKKKR